MNQNAKRTVLALLFAAAFCILLLPLLTFHLQGRFLMIRETAFLGRIHEAHPEWEAEILVMLFEPSDSEEEIRAGEQVFLENGYTRKGPGILEGRLLQKKTLLIGCCASLILTAALMFLLGRLWKLQEREVAGLSRLNETLSEELREVSGLRKQITRLREFIENIAHQIKTPVARAMTSMELLKDEAEEEAGAREHILPDFLRPQALFERQRKEEKKEAYAERISESISHLEEIRKLVEKLLTIGRMEAGEVIFTADPISLPAMLTEVLAEIPEGEDRPVLHQDPPDGTFIWHGSYSWTREALRNLLGNCIEHGKGEQPIEITLLETPEEFRMTIRDHGPGFAEEDLPYIFDRFYRPQEEKKGHVGLGLNLAKLIITGEKGELIAGNHPEGGAVFTLFLPRFREMK